MSHFKLLKRLPTQSTAVSWTVLAAALLISACSTTHRLQAPVIERSTSVPGGTTATAIAPSPAPSGPGYYTVKKGDTLYRIALEFGQDYRDLVTWNNLENANVIRVDQVLRIAPPASAADSAANPAAQTMPVKGSGVEQRPLGTEPAAVSNTASSAANGAAIPGVTAGGPLSAPSGDKRPYSDAALAELSLPEGVVVAPPAAGSSAAPVTAAVGSSAPAVPAVSADGSEPTDDSLGWIWPASGNLVDKFNDGSNKGINIAGKPGDAVVAAADGKVVYAGSVRGYGNLVIVKHNSNFLSAYAHNRSLLVKEQDVVKKGQKIAEIGDSDAAQPGLHFEIRRQGKPVDPLKFLPER
jgi:lipoprotein NlpD